jgi:hypothetical protein
VVVGGNIATVADHLLRSCGSAKKDADGSVLANHTGSTTGKTKRPTKERLITARTCALIAAEFEET